MRRGRKRGKEKGEGKEEIE
jgi:hypothetical protein